MIQPMFLFLALFFLTASEPQATPKPPNPRDAVMRVSLDDARRALERNDVFFVDVRGDVPYSLEHIRGAVSIPLGLIAERASELPSDKLIVTYCSCKNETSSVEGAMILANHGVLRVGALVGGTKAWRDAGLPIDVAPPDPELAPAQPSAPAAARSGGRLAPPSAIPCDRNYVTVYNGKVTAFRRTKKSTSITIATDFATVESVTASSPIWLVNGEPMKTADWKRAGIGKGGRANVWFCSTVRQRPVIDWRPDENGPTGD
jgi:rhodanese-related sulfurtransferase